jgi:AraC family transcriptional regulator
MLAASARWPPQLAGVPPWWKRVRDLIHSRFREQVSLAEISREAGVHSVHVARVCRRLQGRTLGEYVQSLRVQFACELLGRHELPIADIAGEAGFSDQSHLTRMMRRFAHTTPARLRRMLLSGKRKSGRAG